MHTVRGGRVPPHHLRSGPSRRNVNLFGEMCTSYHMIHVHFYFRVIVLALFVVVIVVVACLQFFLIVFRTARVVVFHLSSEFRSVAVAYSSMARITLSR